MLKLILIANGLVIKVVTVNYIFSCEKTSNSDVGGKYERIKNGISIVKFGHGVFSPLVKPRCLLLVGILILLDQICSMDNDSNKSPWILFV